jgi:hypothetical protein
LTKRDCRKMRRTVLKIIKLLQHRWQQNWVFTLKTVSTKTDWRELHRFNIHGRALIPKSLDYWK